jgi:hypothetical protein
VTDGKRSHILEDELLIVRHSGEIPEIALHATLHYLAEDPEGPRMVLDDAEVKALQDAALLRSREIVLRDLDPANRDLSLYRGVKRSIYNWQRLQDFCGRIGRETGAFQAVVRDALLAFLRVEADDVGAGRRSSSINCTADELKGFAGELACDPDHFPENWQALCREKCK